jgi:transketolase
MLTTKRYKELCKEARRLILSYHYHYQRPHIGSSLSCVDIIVDIYYNKMKKGDVFILSKGHAASALYAVLEMKGFKVPTPYPCHPEVDQDGGVFCSTGSLGHGLSVACGVALAKPKNKVYVLLGDGECQEGSVWEAKEFLIRHNLNVIPITDYNGFQACGKLLDNWLLSPIPTTKGKGISFMENDNLWHYKAPNYEEYSDALKELL